MLNHYEALGVRLGATLAEIELAYRGRRSQYHPDRYPQSDPEAIQWANDQMQRVNEAYRVLSDPDRRTLHDREMQQNQQKTAEEHARGTSGPSSAERSPDAGKTKQKTTTVSNKAIGTLRDFLSKFLPPDQEFQRMYIAPNIPLKKLSGAISSYANDVDIDDVLVLVDDTIWGGAGDGILVVEERVIFKELGEARVVVPMEKLADLRSEDNAIYLRAHRLIMLNMTAQLEVNWVFNLIRDCARMQFSEEGRRASSSQSKEPPASSTNKAKPGEHGIWLGQLQRARRQAAKFVDEIAEKHPETEEALTQVVDDFFSEIEEHLYTSQLSEKEAWSLQQVDQLLINIFQTAKTGDSPDHRLFRRRTNEHELLGLLRQSLERIVEAKEVQKGHGR